jgi:hypothetical protein
MHCAAYAICTALLQVEDAVQAIASGKSLKTVLTQQGAPSMTLDMSIAEALLASDAAAATEASFEVLELVKNRGMKKVNFSTTFTCNTILSTQHAQAMRAAKCQSALRLQSRCSVHSRSTCRTAFSCIAAR